MLMTALMVADKLHEAKARMAEKDRLLAETRQPDMFGAEQQEKLARRIDALAQQLEMAADGRGG